MFMKRVTTLGISAVAAAGLVGGVGLGLSSGTASAATTSAPSTAAATSALAPPCLTSQLTGVVTNEEGAAGHTDAVLNLVNGSQATCTLFGFPGLSYVAGDQGTQVGAAARRVPGYEPTVTLAPGHAAQSPFAQTDPYVFPQSSCGLTATRGFRVYPPNETAALFVADPGQTCANPTDPSLSINPLVPGPAEGGTGASTS